MRRSISLLFSVFMMFPSIAHANEENKDFSVWLKDNLNQAHQEYNIPESFLSPLEGKIHFREDVIKLDQRQPEGRITFDQYRKNILTDARIRKGRAFYHKHYSLLSKVSAQYHVPPKYLVALWGIETNYGGYIGRHNILDALATLGFEGRRAAFFSKEFKIALEIAYKNKLAPESLVGSWAGAMGQSQFMPSTFKRYAIDFNKNGKIDLWNDLEDVFASSAHYLSSVGWSFDEKWGREVFLPPRFNKKFIEDKSQKTVSDWRSLGVLTAKKHPLPVSSIKGRIVNPGDGDNYYLVYDNYETLLDWNRSLYFATTVGLLADEIAKPITPSK